MSVKVIVELDGTVFVAMTPERIAAIRYILDLAEMRVDEYWPKDKLGPPEFAIIEAILKEAKYDD